MLDNFFWTTNGVIAVCYFAISLLIFRGLRRGQQQMNQLKIWQSKLKRYLPTVALTAYAQDSGRMALDAGFGMYVPKPVEPDKLVAITQVAGRAVSF